MCLLTIQSRFLSQIPAIVFLSIERQLLFFWLVKDVSDLLSVIDNFGNHLGWNTNVGVKQIFRQNKRSCFIIRNICNFKNNLKWIWIYVNNKNILKIFRKLPMNNVKKVNKLKNYHVCCHTDHFVITCITSAILREQKPLK